MVQAQGHAPLFNKSLNRRFGEYSGKDVETVISRTVLMKPLASIITGYPHIYEPGKTCLDVRTEP